MICLVQVGRFISPNIVYIINIEASVFRTLFLLSITVKKDYIIFAKTKKHGRLFRQKNQRNGKW